MEFCFFKVFCAEFVLRVKVFNLRLTETIMRANKSSAVSIIEIRRSS